MNVSITPDKSSVYVGDMEGRDYTIVDVKEDNGGQVSLHLRDTERAIAFFEAVLEQIKNEAKK